MDRRLPDRRLTPYSMHRGLRALLPFLLGAALVIALPAPDAPAQNVRDFPIELMSRAGGGGTPNAPATNPAISADERFNRIIAYQSAATNITPGANRTENIYAVQRGAPFDRRGTPWRYGRTFLVSRGLGGQPANGPSYRPAVSGWSKGAPRCIAFISRATNLVRGRQSPFAQAYLYRWGRDPARGVIRRVSVDPFGRPGDGDVLDVDVDGDCTNVVFSSRARNLALNSLRGIPGRTRRAEWRSSLSYTPPRGTTSVYVRRLGHSEHSRRELIGITALVSRVGRYGVRRGHNVQARISHARTRTIVYTNVRGADSIVYGTRLSTGRRYRGFRYNTARLSGRRASNPDVGEAGRRFAWQRARGGRNEVVRAEVVRGRLRGGRIATDGQNPSQTSAGTWIFFDTDQALDPRNPPDTNNVHDIYLHTISNRRNRLVSLDQGPRLLRHPSRNPAASARGNYLLFEHRRGIWMKYLGPQ